MTRHAPDAVVALSPAALRWCSRCNTTAGCRDRDACRSSRDNSERALPGRLTGLGPVVSAAPILPERAPSRDPMREMWGRASAWMRWGRPVRCATWPFMNASWGRWSPVPVSGESRGRVTSPGSTEFAAGKKRCPALVARSAPIPCLTMRERQAPGRLLLCKRERGGACPRGCE